MHTILLKQQAIESIRRSHAVLSRERDFSPHNPRVTETLTRLVRTLMQCQSPSLTKFLLETPDLARERAELPALCGLAECEMEKFWARRLISRPVCDLTEFWYFTQYSELCRAEMELFSHRRFHRISFLGSGAFPLTAILLAHHCPDMQIVCVDYDAEACGLAENLVRKLGLNGQINVRCMSALCHAPEENELVICASLLQGREEIYNSLNGSDCALIVRDAEGAYQYLYKPAELPDARFRPLAKTGIHPLRINTSRYYERENVHVAAAA